MATTKRSAVRSTKTVKKAAPKRCAARTCAKKQDKDKDDRKKFIIFAIVFAFIILGGSIGAITWARYVTNFSEGTASVSVADWKVKLKKSDGTEIQTFQDNLAFDYTNDYTHVVANKIAPGSQAVANFTMDLTGTEVDTEYSVAFDTGSNKPTNASVVAKILGSDGGTTATVADNKCETSGTVTTCTGRIELVDSAAFTAENGVVAFQVLVDWDSANETNTGYVVSDNATENAEDTANGEAASSAATSIKVSASVKQYVGHKSSNSTN